MTRWIGFIAWERVESTRVTIYREVHLDFTPEMDVLSMLFERCHTKNKVISQTAYKML